MFDLENEPLDYIISVHVVNMMQNVHLDEETKMRHIQNLINTYGIIQVEFTIKDLFPSMYNKLFSEAA